MALMAALGELTPMPDVAIFADTQDEPEAVYKHLDWLETQLPFPIIRVSKGSLMGENLKLAVSKKSGKTYMKGSIPAFVLNPDGTKGLLGRKCTADFKIMPIHAKARELVARDYLAWRREYKLELSNLAMAKEQKHIRDCDEWNEMQDNALVEMWIGISSDEWIRAKGSREPWIRNTWPLLNAKFSRDMCESWLAEKGYPKAPRSACKKCPFHSDEEWLLQTPAEFAESVAYEKELQMVASMQQALLGVPFLHQDCVPLDQVVFTKKQGHQQVSQFGNECEGLCGV